MSAVQESVRINTVTAPGYHTQITLNGPTITVVRRGKDGSEIGGWNHTYTTNEGFTDPQAYAIDAYRYEIARRIEKGDFYDSRSQEVVGATYEGEKARIRADMAIAARLPVWEAIGFMGRYGATLARLADAYTAPEVARSILTRYADEAYDAELNA
ncbi:hypothetical protein G6W61_10380 [Streptomyces sp. KAI-26]|uniref:hypothetical protein n=1 Tax=Streptomyces sp. KAI-26 TaxID=1169747 RepID=UPI001587B7BF|nr:hypothetical protein [Streptomyces sp. KAI-26]NUV86612.1 hypothetical protein [Streptomyces sp. KAI-26]NUW21193.1 hypothetical protein [Streptomyces roseoviolaceus]